MVSDHAGEVKEAKVIDIEGSTVDFEPYQGWDKA